MKHYPDYELIAQDLLQKNYSHDAILRTLMHYGLERYSAEDVLNDVRHQQQTRRFWGGVAIVTGLFVLVGVFTLIFTAVEQSRIALFSYATIPLVFGASLVMYGIKRL